MVEAFQKRSGMSSKISRFERNGGVFGPVWGVMPNEDCFQWFILAGNHAVNVANDAGNREMFPVEITPIAPEKYRSIQDYYDYINVAKPYW